MEPTSNGADAFTPHIPQEVEAMILPAITRETALQAARITQIEDSVARSRMKGAYDDAKRRHKVLDEARLEIGRDLNTFRDRLLTRLGITPALAHYKELIGIYEPKMRQWDAGVEALRKEQEAKLQAKAREEADRLRREAQERQRKADEQATKLREQAEAQRKAEAEAQERARQANDQVSRRAAEKEAAAAAERAAKLDQRAEQKIDDGQQKAQELAIKADMVPVPVIESQDDRPKKWGAELDIATYGDESKAVDALIKEAAGGNLLARQMLMFDGPTANKLGATLKSHLRVPGVRPVERPYYTTKHK